MGPNTPPNVATNGVTAFFIGFSTPPGDMLVTISIVAPAKNKVMKPSFTSQLKVIFLPNKTVYANVLYDSGQMFPAIRATITPSIKGIEYSLIKSVFIEGNLTCPAFSTRLSSSSISRNNAE